MGKLPCQDILRDLFHFSENCNGWESLMKAVLKCKLCAIFSLQESKLFVYSRIDELKLGVASIMHYSIIFSLYEKRGHRFVCSCLERLHIVTVLIGTRPLIDKL